MPMGWKTKNRGKLNNHVDIYLTLGAGAGADAGQ